jgi:hypothetical protein
MTSSASDILQSPTSDGYEASCINMKKRKPNPKEKGKYKTSTQN